MSGFNGRTSATQAVSDRENGVIELVVHDDEERAFARRTVEDVARARVAVTNDLPLIAEQLLSRLLVVAQRRYRQLTGDDVDVSRWGIRLHSE